MADIEAVRDLNQIRIVQCWSINPPTLDGSPPKKQPRERRDGSHEIQRLVKWLKDGLDLSRSEFYSERLKPLAHRSLRTNAFLLAHLRMISNDSLERVRASCEMDANDHMIIVTVRKGPQS